MIFSALCPGWCQATVCSDWGGCHVGVGQISPDLWESRDQRPSVLLWGSSPPQPISLGFLSLHLHLGSRWSWCSPAVWLHSCQKTTTDQLQQSDVLEGRKNLQHFCTSWSFEVCFLKFPIAFYFYDPTKLFLFLIIGTLFYDQNGVLIIGGMNVEFSGHL